MKFFRYKNRFNLLKATIHYQNILFYVWPTLMFFCFGPLESYWWWRVECHWWHCCSHWFRCRELDILSDMWAYFHCPKCIVPGKLKTLSNIIVTPQRYFEWDKKNNYIVFIIVTNHGCIHKWIGESDFSVIEQLVGEQIQCQTEKRNMILILNKLA